MNLERPGFHPEVFHPALEVHPVFRAPIAVSRPIVVLTSPPPPMVMAEPAIVAPVIVQPLLFAGLAPPLAQKTLENLQAKGFRLEIMSDVSGTITHHAFFGGYTATYEIASDGLRITVADNHRAALEAYVQQAIALAKVAT